ncbi:nucleotidyltransferase domain-containing protein [Paenibacillus eucommiae]|uniref:Nucleotidyltransferase n=1 Tax=Paenibacillus eucommiae TaxID=1355755 RepID=A0ABS4J3N8_9BACL|nr:nucleotidyltransferase domain-containing protein [Paenibacillus eucommiae]MBP1994459.1 putative nucleotidyltransferase [Paenibacillus eucommiae]
MNIYGQKLLLAQKLISELDIPGVIFAFVGGSVGRGDDDEWSDIDLRIF